MIPWKTATVALKASGSFSIRLLSCWRRNNLCCNRRPCRDTLLPGSLCRECLVHPVFAVHPSNAATGFLRRRRFAGQAVASGVRVRAEAKDRGRRVRAKECFAHPTPPKYYAQPLTRCTWNCASSYSYPQLRNVGLHMLWTWRSRRTAPRTASGYDPLRVSNTPPSPIENDYGKDVEAWKMLPTRARAQTLGGMTALSSLR